MSSFPRKIIFILSLILCLGLSLSSSGKAQKGKQGQRRQGPQSAKAVSYKTGCDKAREEAEKQVASLQKIVAEQEQQLRAINQAFLNRVRELEQLGEESEERKQEALANAYSAAFDLIFDRFKEKVTADRIFTTQRLTIFKSNITTVFSNNKIRNQQVLIAVREISTITVGAPQWVEKTVSAVDNLVKVVKLAKISEPDAWKATFQAMKELAPGKLGTFLSLYDSIDASAASVLLSLFSWADFIPSIQSNNEADLKALKEISEHYSGNIKRLKDAKQVLADLSNCNDDTSWQAALQRQRLIALQGSLNSYNQLLQAHAQIFRQAGIRLSQSGFYPAGTIDGLQSGAQSTELVTRNRSLPQVRNKECLPVMPRNEIDALKMESASHKNVCWNYISIPNGEGGTQPMLAATSENPLEKNYKAFGEQARKTLGISEPSTKASDKRETSGVRIQRIELTKIGTFGGAESTASGINNNGDVVGGANDRNGAYIAYIWSSGVLKPIQASNYDPYFGVGDFNARMEKSNHLEATGGYAYITISSLGININNNGQVIGTAVSFHESTRIINTLSGAFLYSNGVMTDLGFLGGKRNNRGFGTLPVAINDAGQVVGCSQLDKYGSEGNQLVHAFLYSNGAMKDLGTLGGGNSCATAINEAGQVVGWSMTGQKDERGLYIKHAFLYSNGIMQDLGTLPGKTNSGAVSVNGTGQVLVVSCNECSYLHQDFRSFMWQSGKSIDLGAYKSFSMTLGVNINDSGMVFGVAGYEGADSAFVWQNGKTVYLKKLLSGLPAMSFGELSGTDYSRSIGSPVGFHGTIFNNRGQVAAYHYGERPGGACILSIVAEKSVENFQPGISSTAPKSRSVSTSFPFSPLPAQPPSNIGVSGSILQSNAITKTQPEYPNVAKVARVSGAVQIQVVISEQGRVIDAQIVSGHPLLRDAALQAAKQWLFKPTEVSGVPVKVQGVLTFNFTLQ